MLFVIPSHREFPKAYEYLKEGGFTASLSGSVHSQIAMDQIIETTINHFSKETGGLSGIMENKSASERWLRIKKDEEDVKNVTLRIWDCISDIWDPKQPIVKINESLATQDMVKNVLNAEEKGGELLQEFIGLQLAMQSLNTMIL